MQFIALIPSYEPNNKLISILKDLKKKRFEIVVINDGSNSLYDDIFKDCRKYAQVLTYSQNRGKGYALKTGLKYIETNYKNCIVVTMDSDGQHSTQDAIHLCELVEDENTIYLGKRLRYKKTPLKSKIGNAITRKVYKLKTGIDIYDTQTGLRAFRSELIPFMLSVDGNRFEYEMNVLLQAPKEKVKLEEYTIETIYENNNRGTHFNTFKDSYLIYKNILKFRR